MWFIDKPNLYFIRMIVMDYDGHLVEHRSFLVVGGVIHRVVGLLHRVVGVLHRVIGVLHRVLGVLHRVVGVSQRPTELL